MTTSSLHLLLPADGSVYTARAAQFLVRHAAYYAQPPQVSLFHVELPIGTPLARAQLSKETLDDYYRDMSAAALLPAEEVLRAAGLAFDSQHVVGDPADQIAAAVQRLQPDLLIMGTHGHSALKGFVMGSVTTKVIAATSVPVLLVR